MRVLLLLSTLVLMGACCEDPEVKIDGACGAALILGRAYRFEAALHTPGCKIGDGTSRLTSIEQIESDSSGIVDVLSEHAGEWPMGAFWVRGLREGRVTLQVETTDGPAELELRVMEPARHVTLHNGDAISELAILEQTRITLEFQVLGRDGTLLSSGGYPTWRVLPAHSLEVKSAMEVRCRYRVTFRAVGQPGTRFEIRPTIAGSTVSGQIVAKADDD